MIIKLKLKGKEFLSMDEPAMKHLRIGAKLAQLEELSKTDTKVKLELFEELSGYVKFTFIGLTDEYLDYLPTKEFLPLIKRIVRWANGMSEEAEKKT